MNKDRRNRIAAAVRKITEAEAALEDAKTIVEEIRDEEEAALENLPESLQQSDRGEAMQGTIEALETALEQLDDMDLSEISFQLEEAKGQ